MTSGDADLTAHGISEEEAGKLIVNRFIEPIVKEVSMEYTVEMNRLIEFRASQSARILAAHP